MANADGITSFVSFNLYELFDKNIAIRIVVGILRSRESVDVQLKKDIYKYMAKNIALIMKKFLEIMCTSIIWYWFRSYIVSGFDLVRWEIFFPYMEKRNILSINRGKEFVFTSPNRFMKFLSSVWPYEKVMVEERGLRNAIGAREEN